MSKVYKIRLWIIVVGIVLYFVSLVVVGRYYFEQGIRARLITVIERDNVIEFFNNLPEPELELNL